VNPEKLRKKIEIWQRGVLTLDKKSVAGRQLETAILLWFDEGDPVAIHTLAVAANDCLHAMGKLVNKPSDTQDWINTQSKAFQACAPRTKLFQAWSGKAERENPIRANDRRRIDSRLCKVLCKSV